MQVEVVVLFQAQAETSKTGNTASRRTKTGTKGRRKRRPFFLSIHGGYA